MESYSMCPFFFFLRAGVWLLSLSIINDSCAVYVSNSFLFIAEWYSNTWMYYNLFSYSSIDGH